MAASSAGWDSAVKAVARQRWQRLTQPLSRQLHRLVPHGMLRVVVLLATSSPQQRAVGQAPPATSVTWHMRYFLAHVLADSGALRRSDLLKQCYAGLRK